MQQILFEKPYQFVPPYRGRFWSWLFKLVRVPGWILQIKEGVDRCEIRDLHLFQESLAAGKAILITPNHPRTADPVAMGILANAANCDVWAMASWHLFEQSRFNAWAMRRMGGFSVHREGVDRQAINTAVELLADGKRPLIIFPEGATSRTNDHLHALLDGVAFIARAAAKKRSRGEGSKPVVVHPIAVKYRYRGDIQKAADDVLTEIEHRLSWRPQRELPILARVAKTGFALLALKEIEFFGEPQTGALAERLERLINRLLHPLEQLWLGGVQQGGVAARVRALRTKIMPDMVTGKVSSAERETRWKQLADLYLAQQLGNYPPDYLSDSPSVDRVLETLERFEEDLCDKARLHGQLTVILQVLPAIEVSPERDRKAAVDPLMEQIRVSLEAALARLALESPPLPQPQAD